MTGPDSAPERENLLDDPALAAAAREGFQGNSVARTYAIGYAAGEQAAMAEYARAGTQESALAGLKAWIETRFVLAAGVKGSSVAGVLAEIDRRLATLRESD